MALLLRGGWIGKTVRRNNGLATKRCHISGVNSADQMNAVCALNGDLARQRGNIIGLPRSVKGDQNDSKGHVLSSL